MDGLTLSCTLAGLRILRESRSDSKPAQTVLVGCYLSFEPHRSGFLVRSATATDPSGWIAVPCAENKSKPSTHAKSACDPGREIATVRNYGTPAQSAPGPKGVLAAGNS